MSVLTLLALKAYWLSGRFYLAMVSTSLFSSILASTLPAIESMVIPR